MMRLACLALTLALAAPALRAPGEALPAFPGADGNGRELSRDGYTNLEFYLNWLLTPADKRVAFSAGQ